jgi:Antibiotic biosynthesis monooxygenase
MAYTYQVGFDIRPEQMGELRIGASLERVLAYLRTLLPGEPGHINSRALSSLDIPDRTHVLFESTWETWDDVEAHRKSSLAEDKVLAEFEPHVSLQDLNIHVYQDVD